MRFKPGQSGNPGGRPKGLTEFRRALEEADVPAKMVKVVQRGMDSEDIEVALAAFDRAAAYLYGRPGALEAGPSFNVAVLPSPMDHNAARIAMGLPPKELSEGEGH